MLGSADPEYNDASDRSAV